jgi:toxin ParE1/3/4
MSAMSSDRERPYGLAPQARTDLENIWRYTAETWSIKQADKYLRELTAVFKLIGSIPMMARERKEFSPPVHTHVHDRHLIVYVIDDSKVEIVRFLGGRQDWMSILNDAEP